MSLTKQELLALIDARAAQDAEFAALVASRNDTAIAAALSVGRIRYAPRLITERGIISALGPVHGEALLAGLEAFAAADPATLPEQIAPAHKGIARVIGWPSPQHTRYRAVDQLLAAYLSGGGAFLRVERA